MSAYKSITQKELDVLLADKTNRPLNLSGYNLSGLNLAKANLDEANLRGSKLDGAILTEASLKKADLSGASMVGVHLQSALMHGVTLDEADLTDADLGPDKDMPCGAYMVGASLKGAVLERANLTKAALDNADLFKVQARRTIFSDAAMAFTNLQEADLTGAQCDHAVLFHAKMQRAVIENADFTKADMVETDMQEICGDGAVFIKTRLEEAKITNAKLNKAVFTEATCTKAHFEGSELHNASFDQANCAEAHFEGARMAGAHFTKAACTNAHFEGAKAQEAVFSEADMMEAVLAGADLTEAHCIETQFYKTNAKGMEASGANLTGANMQYAELSGARFRGAALIHTDMRYAVCMGCSVKKADMSGALIQGSEGLSVSSKQRKVLVTADYSFIKKYKAHLKPFSQGRWYDPLNERFSSEEIERSKADMNRDDDNVTSPVLLNPEGVCQGLCSDYMRFYMKHADMAGQHTGKKDFIEKLESKTLKTSWWRSSKVSSAISNYKKAFYEEAEKNKGMVPVKKAEELQKEYLGEILAGASFAVRVQEFQRSTQKVVLSKQHEVKEYEIDLKPYMAHRAKPSPKEAALSASSSSSMTSSSAGIERSPYEEQVKHYFSRECSTPVLQLRFSGKKDSHVMVIRANVNVNGKIHGWHFFDPNFGEFSFTSPNPEKNYQLLQDVLADITDYYHYVLNGTEVAPIKVQLVEHAEVLAQHVPRIRSSIEKRRGTSLTHTSSIDRHTIADMPRSQSYSESKEKDRNNKEQGWSI